MARNRQFSHAKRGQLENFFHYRTQMPRSFSRLSFDLDGELKRSPLSLIDEPVNKSESEGELAKVASVGSMNLAVEAGVSGHVSGQDAKDICDRVGNEALFKALGIAQVAAMEVEAA